MGSIVVGDKVKLSPAGLDLWKDSETNPYNGIGKVYAVYVSGSYPYQVRWANGKVNAYMKHELERVYMNVQRIKFSVDAMNRAGGYLKTSGTLPLREVMAKVREYQADPAIPYIVLLKDGVQIRAWWRIGSGWLKAGRLPETEVQVKERELKEELMYWPTS